MTADKLTCNRCGVEKSITDFYAVNGKPKRPCKACKKAEDGKRRARRKAERGAARAAETHRLCTRCGEEAPVEEFSGPRGKTCAPCLAKAASASSRRYYEANRERLLEHGKAYKRRARCVTLVKRVQERLAVLEEYHTDPNAGALGVLNRKAYLAPPQIEQDLAELLTYTEAEKAEALKWDAERTTYDVEHGGLYSPNTPAWKRKQLNEFGEKLGQEIADRLTARLRDASYRAWLAQGLEALLAPLTEDDLDRMAEVDRAERRAADRAARWYR